MPTSVTEQRASSVIRRVVVILRAPLQIVFDPALPSLCPSCRELIGNSPGCVPPAGQGCLRAAVDSFVYDPGPGILSMQAIADPPAYHRATAAMRYDEISRSLVHAFKYGDRLDLAPAIGRRMARAGRELLAEADLIVPVPLHWRRLRARRFNQSPLWPGSWAISAAFRSTLRRSSGPGRHHSR